MHQSGPERCYRARNEKPQGEIRVTEGQVAAANFQPGS